MFNGKIVRCEWVGHGQEWSGWNQRTYRFADDTTRSEAWERVLYAEDPFQVERSHRSVPASLIEEVKPADAALALISVDQVPMFVSIPRDRIQGGHVKFTFEDLSRLNGEVSLIRLD